MYTYMYTDRKQHSLKTRRSFFVRNNRKHVIKVTKIMATPTNRDTANATVPIVTPILYRGLVQSNLLVSEILPEGKKSSTIVKVRRSERERERERERGRRE